MYALSIESVVRIVEMVAITPIPRTNYAVEGVVNYHGETVPVVNLRRYLGLQIVPFGLDTHIIVVQIGDEGRMAGLIVDQVLDVLECSEAQIASPGDILPKGLGEAPMLRGVVHTSQGVVLVLDVENLFSAQHAQAWAQALDVLSELELPEDVVDEDSEDPLTEAASETEPEV
jgi:purine-binding chemotaxis protein CheW